MDDVLPLSVGAGRARAAGAARPSADCPCRPGRGPNKVFSASPAPPKSRESAAGPGQMAEEEAPRAPPWRAGPALRRAAHDVRSSRTRTGDALGPEPASFGALLLSGPVLEGLRAAGFERPSPVQLKAIPLGRCGLDLIVQAKSGTGKTCVFSTVALDSLILENPATQILVLAPTREIAVQIHSVITAIGVKLEGLECHVFIGGTPLFQDKSRLKKCHIAVGSPGRIKQLIELDYLNTASIRLFILDEADKLLEEGSFQEQINWIYSSLPANKQMLAVSATYPECLANALTRYMRDPTFVRLNSSDPSLIGLKQYYKIVNSHPLPHKTFEEKTQHLQELFSRIPFNQALVFSNLHSRAQHLADILTSKGFPAECISGSMNQNQRLDAMAKLKQFHCRVLISTDLTSRGIDAEKVNLVVNLDVPMDWETYMHRIGRAGRFGTLGLAVTYCCRGEEENVMMTIAQKCNLNLLCLPDPIPAGLMEECLEWDVEVKAAVPSARSVSAPRLPLQKAALKPEQDSGSPGAVQHLAAPPDSATSPAVATKSKRCKPKLSRKDPGDWLQPEKAEPPNSVQPLDPGTKVLETLRQSGSSKPQGKEASQSPLPKIPCLSSFKAQLPSLTWTFAELVEDYEHFIKEGLEKQVQIIRHYTGPEKQTGPHQNGPAERQKSEESGQAPVSQFQSEYSDSEGDSYSSGASSSCKGNEFHLEGSSDSQAQDGGRDMDTGDWTPPSQSPKVRATPRPEPEGPPQIHTRRLGKGPSAKQNAKRSWKRIAQQSSRPFQRESREDSWDDCSRDRSGDRLRGFGSDPQSYENYWRSYYQAWQHYYMSASHLYSRNMQRHSNWMTAYHMNAVYLQELMRGDL
ncbi:probable ATP-dependent RNA helicase DDX20 [Tachyglossus aculeatus]|uniref:probable ATP-dependent RNA helicase DDX20 n=1 Tax=Tachyglossus aculeatus TaxID=9261 RepID=UPI0018F6C416|nr:probable ATP-dependent RNA helicase DDX20 [Tachyglossus aculeatus]